MAVSNIKNPASAVSDSTIYSINWANPTNCFTSDNVRSATSPTVSGDVTIVDDEIYLQTAGGVTIGNNKADTSTAWSTTESYISYGDENDKWGATLTPAIVNATDFGVGVGCKINTSQSGRLYASNFSFNIPTNAVISGIKVEVEKSKLYASRGNTTVANIDHIRMTIYYGFPHLHHFA